MDNDPVLRAFSDWHSAQPEADRAGLLLLVNDHATRSCMVWWAGPKTAFLARMRAAAHSLGVRLEIHQARWDQREMQRAMDLIAAERERLRDEFGFELWGIGHPRPAFIGLTLRGVAVGDTRSEELPSELIDAVCAEIAELLRDNPIGRDEVRIEYGYVVPLSLAEPQPSA